MAGPNQDFRSPKKDLRAAQAKPGRALLLILLLAVMLTGGMLLTGEKTPRLGIDLAGGTSITLSATADARNQDAINPTNLQTAVDIIERRVNGLGVSEAEVQSQGDRNIIINIPRGTDQQQAREQVGTTAQLGFRPVWSIQSALPAGEESELPPGEPDEAEEGPDGAGDAENPDDAGGAEDGADTDEERTDQSLPSLSGQTGDAASATVATQASFRTEDGADEEEAEEQEAEEPAGLEAELGALDCTTEEARGEAVRAAANAEESDPVVTCDQEGFVKYELGPVAVPGTGVDDADAVLDTERGLGWIVTMNFSSEGSRQFADITAELATQFEPRNQFAIVLDGEVVSAPRVSQRLGGGSAQIEGNFTQEDAQELANILKFGALPITFEEANMTTVSPTLGTEQLKAGLIAGGIGLLLVAGYLFFYYRVLSLVAIASLIVMGLMTYTIMTLLGPGIGFALSLPAVCGAIVAIGITADSFIVYFERIRDEVREGRPIRAAIERAWPRARRTILISDVVSFLAAVVLFLVSVGSVQGFAFVLGLTTALDIIIVFWLTKPLVTLAARKKFFYGGNKWSGLDPARLGANPPLRRGARRPVTVPAEPKEA
ncbi:protein translocase subunit SecD [Streptomyces sp. ACA25]|uniref:protein translocase subunit SecD n=1 Tax=Streptomyces sp. ACA25 TaxID=3022596 RepID=UPI0023074300|nr:protein translocase subunit SecD [Streptomyces sp. ACA25]MDB1088935.1 protein translocase subunit SecD [Streptomyces sp. ACA25]